MGPIRIGILTAMIIIIASIGIWKWRISVKKSSPSPEPTPPPTPTDDDSTPAPTPPPAPADPAPNTPPTPKTPSAFKAWWEKEWKYVLASMVAYVFFWLCLLWFFPKTAEISTDRLLLLGGLIVLGIIGLASRKLAATIICVLLLIVVLRGIAGRMESKGYKIPKIHHPVSRTTTSKPPPTSSASVTLSAKDGWVPIKIQSGIGKTRVTKVTPSTAVVKVRRPDGKTLEDGYGHEEDSWTSEQRNHKEEQVWFVHTNENTSVTYTVTWAN